MPTAEWIFTSDRVDLAKLSNDTKVKLIRFADVAPQYRLSKRIVHDEFGFAEVIPQQVLEHYFRALADLETIPEPEVKFFVDQIDLRKRTDRLHARGASDWDCEIDFREMLGFESEIILLGERIMRAPTNTAQ
jgi:hypothetical protein